MPRTSPYRIVLSRVEAAELSRRAMKYTLPYYQVVRAKMILLAADGLGNDEIGYLVPPYDYVLSESSPYLSEAPGNHYEETNSCTASFGDLVLNAFHELAE